MDGYTRASGFVLYPFVFVAGLNKHDCSRRTRSAENYDRPWLPMSRSVFMELNYGQYQCVTYLASHEALHRRESELFMNIDPWLWPVQ